MAAIASGTKFKIYDPPGTAFTNINKPGGKVEFSGIYKCVNCGREITSNMHPNDDTFPPHNKSSTCQDAKWKLHVVTDTMGDNFASVK
ncbi:hypothetical protein [Acinetobacter sp. YH16052]|uniref:hypothetical protein n=1 Tax=Acinetobacter sp. YH16052 TaxID=2601191 RepID=UPI0015D41998|nr:hypothetical protein [Acinetobacter sp. YH16052]